MANQFFSGEARREVHMRSVALLVGRNEERRIKINLSLPLTGGSLIGMPDWLDEAHDAVTRQLDIAIVNKSFEGMSCNVFSTPQSDKRQIQLTSCQLTKFSVIREGDSEIPDVSLLFTIYTPFNTAAWKWAGELGGHDFFAKFEQTQAELELEKTA